MNKNRTPKKPAPIVPPPDPPQPEFYRGDAYEIDQSLGHLARVLLNSMNRAIDASMQAFDLTAMQWKPLLILSKGRVSTAAELARLNCSDNGAMTRMLDRLEAKGLLRRVRSESDRRVVHLELTQEGQRVSELIPYGLSAVLNTHLAGFTSSEFEQLKSMLLRMIANGQLAAGEMTP